jgi:hypothetical protein
MLSDRCVSDTVHMWRCQVCMTLMRADSTKQVRDLGVAILQKLEELQSLTDVFAVVARVNAAVSSPEKP